MSTPGNREVAHRVFAAEFDDADFEYSESDEERAPNYVVTPSGARVNRLYFVGVLTEKEQVNEEVLRARVVDPTGAFVVYAGQYQPDALAFLESTDPPAFVAVTGKARTFQPEDSDRTFTSVRPETISAVEAADRDRWAVTAAEHTLDRVATMADALGRTERGADLTEALVADGVPVALADGVALAIEHYDTSEAYLDALRTLALDTARVVAGDREEVRGLDLAPDEAGETAVDREALEAAGPDVLAAEESAETVGDVATSTAATAETPASEATDEAAAEATAEEETASADAEATTTEEAAAETADTTAEGDATAETADTSAGSTDATTETATADDDLGDFEGGSIAAEGDETAANAESTADEAAGGETAGGETAGDESAGEAAADAPTADTDEMYEFDEDERQEIEEEYGTEFSTGTEVESPEESEDAAASAETEDEAAATAEESDEETAAEGTEAAESEAEPEAETEAAEEPADEDVSVDDVLLDTMRDLDDGDGAPRSELIEAVVERTGADEATVEDAIQDALMGGQCYEPEDDRLKPI